MALNRRKMKKNVTKGEKRREMKKKQKEGEKERREEEMRARDGEREERKEKGESQRPVPYVCKNDNTTERPWKDTSCFTFAIVHGAGNRRKGVRAGREQRKTSAFSVTSPLLSPSLSFLLPPLPSSYILDAFSPSVILSLKKAEGDQ